MKTLVHSMLNHRKSTPRRNRNLNLQIESLERRELMAADFQAFDLVDASGDVTADTVFTDGALRVDYGIKLSNGSTITDLQLILENNTDLIKYSLAPELLTNEGIPDYRTDALIDLRADASLAGGEYMARVLAETSDGTTATSSEIAIQVLKTFHYNGSFQGENFDLEAELKNDNIGIVLHAQGGTDTLDLGGLSSEIKSINGMHIKEFDPLNTAGLPIHQGYAVDHIVFENGSEVYFTGIENIEGDSKYASSIELMVTPKDTNFNEQWNLHVSDVPSAWRFTTGSEKVLLVSLDTGVLPEDEPAHVYGSIVDLTEKRMITDPTDVDNSHFLDDKFGHGHMAISVMSSTPNNGEFVAGINWNSTVFVSDVYDADTTLQSEIEAAMAYAKERGLKVVFQGGIQGESWLNSGGSQAELEALLSENEDLAVFAVAAGNAGVDIDATTGVNTLKSGGVARLQTSHKNVMAIGALQRDGTTVDGMANAADVYKAGYSNFGSSLTLMGATDSPATWQFTGIVDPQFDVDTGLKSFGGTSAANPNVAGIASLVWSVNVDLTGIDVREILTDTAMDNLPNAETFDVATGKSESYGHGLANADLAVRRSLALQKDEALVTISKDLRSQPISRSEYEFVGSDVWFDRYLGTTDDSNEKRFTTSKAGFQETQNDKALLSKTSLQQPLSATEADLAFSASSEKEVQKDYETTKTYTSKDTQVSFDSVFADLGTQKVSSRLRFTYA